MNTQQMMEEIDRLARLCEAKDAAFDKTVCDYEEILSEAQAQIAMQAEALELMLKQFTKSPSTLRDTQARGHAHRAIDATSETVAAWRAKENEPLRREVAMLRDAVINISHTDWPTEDVLNKLEKAISDTQATALAYEREVENRGAVKARDDFKFSQMENLGVRLYEYIGDAELRAANKGEEK